MYGALQRVKVLFGSGKNNLLTALIDMFSRVISVAEASGATAISSRFSLPSILNFSHFSYLNSTRMLHASPHLLFGLTPGIRWNTTRSN